METLVTAHSASTLQLAVVGAGRWGSRVLAAFRRAENARVSVLCDVDPGVVGAEQQRWPELRVTTRFSDVLDTQQVSAVALATPPETHCDMSVAALAAGKDVFVEKPLATSVADALRVRDALARTGRRLMVGHLLQYHPVVLELRRLVAAGEFGELRQVFCQRSGGRTLEELRARSGAGVGSVGRVARPGMDAWWTLAPHDVSFLRFIVGRRPAWVEAVAGSDRLGDVCDACLHYADGMTAHVAVSLSAREKMRQIVVVGTKLVATFDDTHASRKLRLFRPGRRTSQPLVPFLPIELRDIGGVDVPRVEPLLAECQHFVDSITRGTAIRSDIEDGIDVTSVLEAVNVSVTRCGDRVSVEV